MVINRRQTFKSRRQCGFSLVEVSIAILIVTLASMGMVVSVIVTRHMAEYDKQRLAAIAAARTYLEEQTRQKPFPSLVSLSDVTLDNFNTPDELTDDLNASLNMRIFRVNADGTRGAEWTESPTTDERVEVVVTVEWQRTGSRSSKTVTEELHTYVAPNLSAPGT